MDARGTRSEGLPAKHAIVVLPDGEDRSIRRTRCGNGRDAVIGPGGQVNDDPVDVRQQPVKRRGRMCRQRCGASPTDQGVKSGSPDQVIGQDGDPHAQGSDSAR